MRRPINIALIVALAASSANADITAIIFHNGNSPEYQTIKAAATQIDAKKLSYVDTTGNTSLSTVAAYRVQSTPMTVFLDDGVEIDRIGGASLKWATRVSLRLSGSDAWRPYRSAVRIRNGNAIGSGVIVSSEIGSTIIITAKHVVADSPEVMIQLFRDSLTEVFKAKVICLSDTHDLALVEITDNRRPLPCSVGFADSADVEKGDLLYSIGCSLGAPPSLLIGSAHGQYEQGIITTPYPKQGRSGGGLFNDRFELVGICSAQSIQSNMGFYPDAAGIRLMFLSHGAKAVETSVKELISR